MFEDFKTEIKLFVIVLITAIIISVVGIFLLKETGLNQVSPTPAPAPSPQPHVQTQEEESNSVPADSLGVGINNLGSIEIERIEPILIRELDFEQDVITLEEFDKEVNLKKELDPEYLWENHQLYYAGERVGYGFIDYASNTIEIFSFEYKDKKYLLLTDTIYGTWSNSFTNLHFYVLDEKGFHEITEQYDSTSNVILDSFVILGHNDILLVSGSNSSIGPGVSHSASIHIVQDRVKDALETGSCQTPIDVEVENQCESTPEILLLEKNGDLHVELRGGEEGAELQTYLVSSEGKFIAQ
jgi:hypothetical protein